MVSKYAVEVCSYIELNNMVGGINRNFNLFALEEEIYSKFQSSKEYHALRRMLNEKLEYREKQIGNIRK